MQNVNYYLEMYNFLLVRNVQLHYSQKSCP